MNSAATIFLLLNAIMLLFLPRRWAPLPLLVGACYMTLGQGVDLGPFTFTVIRVLIAVGIVRVIARGERLPGGMNSLDWLMAAWAVWAVVSGVFRTALSDALVFRLGLVYNACGVYFLLRVFCRSFGDVVGICRSAALLLIPLAAEMLYETLLSHNMFSVLEGVAASPVLREGRVRAQGPFAHPILAGTIGASSIPLMIGLRHAHRKTAVAGIAACLVIVATSASSGPVMSAAVGLGALALWRFRGRTGRLWLFAVFGYIVLEVAMNAPAYYLLARFDLVGGSTGWHRARLIETAVEHFHEWWLIGADYTRHWMPTGVTWSADHTDITNYYLKMGVIGGLPLMLLFMALLARGFSLVGKAAAGSVAPTREFRFLAWALGASLFTHAATFVSVAYFDQSFLFLYLVLAAIGSSRAASSAAADDIGVEAGPEPATLSPLIVGGAGASTTDEPPVCVPAYRSATPANEI